LLRGGGLALLGDRDRGPDGFELLDAQVLEASLHLVEGGLHLGGRRARGAQLPLRALLLFGQRFVLDLELVEVFLPRAARQDERGACQGGNPGEPESSFHGWSSSAFPDGNASRIRSPP